MQNRSYHTPYHTKVIKIQQIKDFWALKSGFDSHHPLKKPIPYRMGFLLENRIGIGFAGVTVSNATSPKIAKNHSEYHTISHEISHEILARAPEK